jgi:hypothetical protein
VAQAALVGTEVVVVAAQVVWEVRAETVVLHTVLAVLYINLGLMGALALVVAVPQVSQQAQEVLIVDIVVVLAVLDKIT